MTSFPSQIGRYRVLSTLGKGGFATVYLAEDPSLDATVAIKILSDECAFQGDIRRRFIREAQRMRDLAGPGVVVVHEIADHEGKPFLVMEHCNRGNLDERLDNLARSINFIEARGLARALTNATSVVHREEVVHRDLKPSNFLIRQTRTQSHPVIGELLAQDEELVLSDFGLAKDLDTKSSRITLAGGTPGFGAPEQFRGDPTVNARADVYALSAIIVAALSGEAPRTVFGPNDEAFSGQALEATGTLKPALAQGLEFDPDARQADATEWYETLTQAGKKSSSIPNAHGRPTFSRRFVLKAGPVAVLGLAGVTVVAGNPARLLGPSIIGPSEGSPGDEATFSIDGSKPVTWTVSGRQQSKGRVISISPSTSGTYTIGVATTLQSATHTYTVIQPKTELRIAGPGYAPINQTTRYFAAGTETAASTWTIKEKTSTADIIELKPDDVGPVTITLSSQNGEAITRTITAVDIKN